MEGLSKLKKIEENIGKEVLILEKRKKRKKGMVKIMIKGNLMIIIEKKEKRRIIRLIELNEKGIVGKKSKGGKGKLLVGRKMKERKGIIRKKWGIILGIGIDKKEERIIRNRKIKVYGKILRWMEGEIVKEEKVLRKS